MENAFGCPIGAISKPAKPPASRCSARQIVLAHLAIEEETVRFRRQGTLWPYVLRNGLPGFENPSGPLFTSALGHRLSPRPLFPQKRTFGGALGMSVKCKKATFLDVRAMSAYPPGPDILIRPP